MALFKQFHPKKTENATPAILAISASPDTYGSTNSHYSQNSRPPVFENRVDAAIEAGLLTSSSSATNGAGNAVSWLRSQGVAVTLSEDGRRPVLSAERAGDLPQAYINRLMDLSGEIVELLYEERKTVRADRQRYKSSEPWNWPEDLDDAIRIAAERNKALEKRRETARYCLCQKLAENEWTTKRGRVWVCEPCRAGTMASWACCRITGRPARTQGRRSQ
jgi:hypothetical protein